MSDLYLDLRDKTRVIDFFVEHLEYASPAIRKDAEIWIRRFEEGEPLSTDKLAQAVRTFAWAIWPARYAVERYFAKEGQEDEWTRVCSTVRPSTAHILKRFRKGTGSATLDETLNHIEADVAFGEGDRREITDVRAHLRLDYWRAKKESLDVFVKDGEQHVTGYQSRFEKLHGLAADMPRSLQDEILSKIERYQDRILFEGETVPMELLDQELAYYTEQKEISPTDEG